MSLCWRIFRPKIVSDCATGHVEYKCEVMYDHINTPAMRINYKCDENAKICTTDNNSTLLNPNYQMYLPLLALLALPVIAFLIYRFVLKKLFEPHYIVVNAPRVGTYIEVINENGTGSTSNIQMTDQSNEFSIYENIKSNTEISEAEPIYGNITTEDTNATDQSNECSIYGNIKNNTEVSEVEPIYGNITTEATSAVNSGVARIF